MQCSSAGRTTNHESESMSHTSVRTQIKSLAGTEEVSWIGNPKQFQTLKCLKNKPGRITLTEACNNSKSTAHPTNDSVVPKSNKLF